MVSRIQHLFPNYSQPYIATLSNKEVKDYYQKRSEFLKGLGFDIVLAPVVDLAVDEKSIMYKRSYGNNVGKIVELACICIDEQRKNGLQSCIKHFPGIGRTVADSHNELPLINLDLNEWENNEGLIFKEIINSGVENILVGHALYPQINPEISSLSKYWINDILRGQLGFKGKVILDDVSMKALKDKDRELSTIEKSPLRFKFEVPHHKQYDGGHEKL